LIANIRAIERRVRAAVIVYVAEAGIKTDRQPRLNVTYAYYVPRRMAEQNASRIQGRD